MTVRVRRSFEVIADIEDVWELLSNEAKRAEAIELVDSFEEVSGGTHWNVNVPLPLSDRTVTVKTNDVERDPPTYVKFVGRSKLMNVTGEHSLTQDGDTCRVVNTFVVDGSVPGVEKFFKRNIDGEIENIMHAVSDHVAAVEEA